MFQYSLTNLVWCNIGVNEKTTRSLEVSVFSDESRVVQLKNASVLRSPPEVSVFSDESRVVQPTASSIPIVPAASFSIL